MSPSSPFPAHRPPFLDLGRWLPPAPAPYRTLLTDAAAFFLQALPPHRQAELAADQLRLPGDAPPEQRLFALAHRCPTLHKLAQVLARDPRLPPALRRQLRRLESLPAQLPIGEITRRVVGEIGQPPGLSLAARPLAEASVAVVVRFRWQRPDRPGVDGVFKLLKPGIRRRLAGTLARNLLFAPLWEPDGLFHADPHGGNLLLLPDGRIGVLDWSLVGRLSPRQRQALLQLPLGGLMLDPPRICDALGQLCPGLDPADPALGERVRESLEPLRGGGLPDLDWLLQLIDGLAVTRRPSFPAELVLFRKAAHMLQGVIRSIAPQESLERHALTGALAALAAEWPLRLWTVPTSRDLPSRLSWLDLWQAGLALPLTAQRLLRPT